MSSGAPSSVGVAINADVLPTPATVRKTGPAVLSCPPSRSKPNPMRRRSCCDGRLYGIADSLFRHVLPRRDRCGLSAGRDPGGGPGFAVVAVAVARRAAVYELDQSKVLDFKASTLREHGPSRVATWLLVRWICPRTGRQRCSRPVSILGHRAYAERPLSDSREIVLEPITHLPFKGLANQADHVGGVIDRLQRDLTVAIPPASKVGHISCDAARVVQLRERDIK
jgi:hypothetical protein